MARRERYLVGLDVGTAAVTVIVGEVMDDGTLDIIGIGMSEIAGMLASLVRGAASVSAFDDFKRANETGPAFANGAIAFASSSTDA